MLGQVTFGWINVANKQVLGGKSFILIGDPSQLPPVADKRLYHAKPSNAVGEQGYQTDRMFDKVVKLTVNQQVHCVSFEQVAFRELLLQLCKGESTDDDWKLLLTCQPSAMQIYLNLSMPSDCFTAMSKLQIITMTN